MRSLVGRVIDAPSALRAPVPVADHGANAPVCQVIAEGAFETSRCRGVMSPGIGNCER